MRKLLYLFFILLLFSCKTVNNSMTCMIRFVYDKSFNVKDSIDSICVVEEIPLVDSLIWEETSSIRDYEERVLYRQYIYNKNESTTFIVTKGDGFNIKKREIIRYYGE